VSSVVRVVEGSGAASIVAADRRSSIRVGHGTSHGVSATTGRNEHLRH
jgi:hypothetical protein